MTAGLLTEPYLLMRASGRYVVSWCTEFPGIQHWVLLGEGVRQLTVEHLFTPATQRSVQRVPCSSILLDQLAEDIESVVHRSDLLPEPGRRVRQRIVWRHRAEVSSGHGRPYRVVSITADGVPLL